jgi:predicted nucleic acid-binding protein
MAHWDTSALLKLYLAEPDSTVFEGIAPANTSPGTAFIARHEARTAFSRREAEGALPPGEAENLYQSLVSDMEAGLVLEQPQSPALEAELGDVLRLCLMSSPPVFVRTNDALHLAAARVAGETEFVTADVRQRAAALHLGFKVLP